MRKKAIILIKCQAREYHYGVGAYLYNLIHGFRSFKSLLNVLVIDLAESLEPYQVANSGNITTVRLPFRLSPVLLKTEYGKSLLSKASLKIANILYQNFDIKHATMICNTPIEYIVADALREVAKVQIAFVFHTATRSNSFPDEMSLPEFVSKMDQIIFPSQYCRHFYFNNYRIEYPKATLIYNGIAPAKGRSPVSEQCLLKCLNLRDDQQLILYVGRIDYQKGVKALLESFQILATKNMNCHLILVGDGDIGSFLPYCRGIYSRVTFTGFMKHEEVCNLYRICDVGVIPSLNENCSYTALEMMSYQLPVVAAQTGGLPEIFTDGENGIIVKTCLDISVPRFTSPLVSTLAEAIDQLLSDKQLSKRLSKQAFRDVSTRFSSQMMARKYFEIAEMHNTIS